MNPSDLQCLFNPLGCTVNAGLGAAASGAAGDAVAQLAQSFYSGFDDFLKQFLTSWVGSGFVVSLDNKATAWFHSATAAITVTLLTVGLIVGGIRVMFANRGEPLKEVLAALGRAVAVITLGTAAIQIFVWGGDAYAQWILKASGSSAAAGQMDADFVAKNPALALLFGLIGMLAVFCQWIIMFVRQASLVLLNAFWQLAASAAMLRRGEQAFEKVTAWILAFIIYAPLAASIYAFAWRLKNGDDGIGGVLYGLALIILAVLALPALMRLLVPVSAAMGSAVGGAMALGLVAGAVQAGVAIGAAVATGGASAGASGAAAAAGGGEAAGAAGAAGSASGAVEGVGTAAGATGDAAGAGAAGEGATAAGSDSAGGVVGDGADGTAAGAGGGESVGSDAVAAADSTADGAGTTGGPGSAGSAIDGDGVVAAAGTDSVGGASSAPGGSAAEGVTGPGADAPAGNASGADTSAGAAPAAGGGAGAGSAASAVDGGAAGSAPGATAGSGSGAASGAGQSPQSRAGWAAAREAADRIPNDGSTAEGMINE